MKLFKKLFLHSPSHYITALCFAIVISGVYVLINGYELVANYINGISVGGLVTILVGGLMTTTYFGSFDGFGYSFGKIFKRDKYSNIKYSEYVEQQNIKRKEEPFTFIPFYVVGIVFIIIYFVIELIK